MSYTINTSRIAISKKELTAAEIAKKNFNKMSAANRINELYDNDILYKDILSQIINKMNEYHDDLAFDSLSTNTWYIAFENFSMENYDNFTGNLLLFNFLDYIINDEDIIIFNSISNKYQNKDYNPKYLDLKFSDSIKNVKTYKRNVDDNGKITYEKSDSSEKKIYKITRNFEIITKSKLTELGKTFSRINSFLISSEPIIINEIEKLHPFNDITLGKAKYLFMLPSENSNGEGDKILNKPLYMPYKIEEVQNSNDNNGGEQSAETKVLRFEREEYVRSNSIYDTYNVIMSDAIFMYLDDEQLENNVLNNVNFESDKLIISKWAEDSLYHFGLKNETDAIVEETVTFTLDIDGKTYSASTHVILTNPDAGQAAG